MSPYITPASHARTLAISHGDTANEMHLDADTIMDRAYPDAPAKAWPYYDGAYRLHLRAAACRRIAYGLEGGREEDFEASQWHMARAQECREARDRVLAEE